MIRCIRLFALPLLLAPGLLGCNSDVSEGQSEASSDTTVTNESIREVSVPAGTESGRPRFNWDNNQLLLSWTEPTEDSLNALRYAMWTGSGWSEPQTAATGQDWFVNWADTPGVVHWHDGGLLAHYLVSQANEDNPYAYDIHLTTSSDGVFDASALLNDDGTATEHGFVSVIPGLNAFVWLDGRGYETAEAMSLRFARLSTEGVLSDSAVLDDRVCDCCPTDANKIEPGICGSGVDDDADSDGDGVADCIDQCPGVDDSLFAPSCSDAIPTVSAWGLGILTLLLLTAAKVRFTSRSRRSITH